MEEKILKILKYLGIVIGSIAGFFSIISFATGAFQMGIQAFFISTGGSVFAVGSQYVIEIKKSVAKFAKTIKIPEDMKIKGSNNQNEELDKQQIYVVSPSALDINSYRNTNVTDTIILKEVTEFNVQKLDDTQIELPKEPVDVINALNEPENQDQFGPKLIKKLKPTKPNQ